MVIQTVSQFVAAKVSTVLIMVIENAKVRAGVVITYVSSIRMWRS